MPSFPVRSWQRVLELSEQMLSRARGGDWNGVAALQRQREGALPGAFTDPVAEPDLERVAALLPRILACNVELTMLAGAARDAHSQELRRLRRGRLAHCAYERASA